MEPIARYLAPILSATLCAACVSDDVGSGPLHLSPQIMQHFEQYQAGSGQGSPLVFAVSEDGQAAGWYTGGAAHGLGGSHAYQAIQICEAKARRGVKCKVFARGPNVVWRGPVDIASGSRLSVPKEETKMDAVVSFSRSVDGKDVRSIAASWDGVGDLLSGEIAATDARAGNIQLTLPDELGHCAGRYDFRSTKSGSWSLTCNNGLAAAGKMVALGKGKGATGNGRDNQGRLVKFTIGPARDE